MEWLLYSAEKKGMLDSLTVSPLHTTRHKTFTTTFVKSQNWCLIHGLCHFNSFKWQAVCFSFVFRCLFSLDERVANGNFSQCHRNEEQEKQTLSIVMKMMETTFSRIHKIQLYKCHPPIGGGGSAGRCRHMKKNTGKEAAPDTHTHTHSVVTDCCFSFVDFATEFSLDALLLGTQRIK